MIVIYLVFIQGTHDVIDAAGKTIQALKAKVSSWVDVRDVAEAHVRALLKQEAGGHRIIVSAGNHNWQEWRKFV